MATHINELLALPQKERRKIAEELWSSLKPSDKIVKEEEAILNLLEERWHAIESGKTKLYNSSEIKKKIQLHRNRKQ